MYHLSAQVVQRSKARSAIAMAAYRSGTALVDEETGEVKDFTHKSKIFGAEIFAPTGSPAWATDRQELWNRAEGAEKRKDAQLAREITVALPADLNFRQMMGLTRDYVQSQFVAQGMVADVAYHNLSGDNPHAHIMLTTRELDGEAFGKKNRDWNDRDALAKWREAWADHACFALAAAGSKVRLDHRSYEAQGIDKIPTKHLGPSAAAMEARGIRTERGDVNREIASRNDELFINQTLLATINSKIRLRKMEIRDEQRDAKLRRTAPGSEVAMVTPTIPTPAPAAVLASVLRSKRVKAQTPRPEPAPRPQAAARPTATPAPPKEEKKMKIIEKTGAQRIAELVGLLKESRSTEWMERRIIEQQIMADNLAAEKALAAKVAVLERRLEAHKKQEPTWTKGGLFGTSFYLPHHVKKEEKLQQKWESRKDDLKKMVAYGEDKLYALTYRHKNRTITVPAERDWRESHREEIDRRDEIIKEMKSEMEKEKYSDIEKERVLAGGDKDKKSPYELHVERQEREAVSKVVDHSSDFSAAVADPAMKKALKGAAQDTGTDDDPPDDDTPEPESFPSPGM